MQQLLIRVGNRTQSTGWGIGFMMTGMLIVPIMDAIAKHLGQQLSPMQITWGRFVFQLLIMGVAVIVTLNVKALIPKRPLIHTLRGLLLAIATTFFFFSLLYLPLANAIAIFFVQPMIVTMLSAIFLGETIGWHRKIAVLAGFAGALLIIQPGSEAFSLAALLPLGSALFFASYIAFTRSVANIDHPLTMQFSSSVGATVFLTLGLIIASANNHELFAPRVPSFTQWGLLAAIGLIASVGHLLVVVAINRAPASLLAPFGYMEIVSATLLGWLFFSDWPSLKTWAGIAVIVCSGLYVFMREQNVRKLTNFA